MISTIKSENRRPAELIEILKKMSIAFDLLKTKTITVSHASSLSEATLYHLSDLLSSLSLSFETNEYTPLKKRNFHKLEFLDLEAPLIPDLTTTFCADKISFYKSLSSVENQARLMKLKEIASILQKAAIEHFNPLLEMIHKNRQAFLAKTVQTPRKTLALILERVYQKEIQFSKLDAGSFGEVGLRQSNLMKLALKRANKSDNEQFVTNEAVKLLQLNHPNIIKIVGFGCEGSEQRLYIEYVDGKTLKDYCGLLACNYEKILKIAHQIASGITYLHENNIIHHDLKPANIMIDPKTDEVKIIDFGLSCYTSDRMIYKGNPGYMAPELFQKTPGTLSYEKIDVWSFGMILFFLITGGTIPYPKYKNMTGYADSFKQKTWMKPCNIRSLIEAQSELTQAITKKRDPKNRLRSLIEKCLHGDPTIRPSIGEIKGQLESLLSENESFCVIS